MGRGPLSYDEVRHGTLTGYSWHHKNKVPPCDACKQAKSKHQADVVAREKADLPRAEAWMRSCSRLAERYPAEFREILLEELARIGWKPPEEGQGDEQ